MATATARVKSSVVMLPGSWSGWMPVSLIAWSTLSRMGVKLGPLTTGGFAYDMRRLAAGCARVGGTVGCSEECGASEVADRGSCTRGTGVSLRDGE